LSSDPYSPAPSGSPATAATAQPEDGPPDGEGPSAGPPPAAGRAGEAAPTGTAEGDAGVTPERLRPRPEVEQVLAAAAGGEGRVPSFAEMVRYNATLTRQLGRAQRAIGVLTVERDALKRRLEEARDAAASPEPEAARTDDAGRGRWLLAVALLGLLALLLIAWWAFGWSAGDLPGAAGGQPTAVPTPGG
jgi:hypothetical protein